MSIEHEVKLGFATAEAARQAVTAAGGRLDVSRRLLDDRLFDTSDERLRRAGSALRIRRDGPQGYLTFKGPVRPGPVKSREEIETKIGDADAVETVLMSIGFRRWFRAEKYREEYAMSGARVVIDDTPIGVFIEVEGPIEAIDRVAEQLGRGRNDYQLDSYAGLYAAWCRDHGRSLSDMVFTVQHTRP